MRYSHDENIARMKAEVEALANSKQEQKQEAKEDYREGYIDDLELTLEDINIQARTDAIYLINKYMNRIDDALIYMELEKHGINL